MIAAKSALELDSKSSHLLPVYTAEKRVSLDICEARLNLASQPFLGILLGPRQLLINGTRNRSNRISQQCDGWLHITWTLIEFKKAVKYIFWLHSLLVHQWASHIKPYCETRSWKRYTNMPVTWRSTPVLMLHISHRTTPTFFIFIFMCYISLFASLHTAGSIP